MSRWKTVPVRSCERAAPPLTSSRAAGQSAASTEADVSAVIARSIWEASLKIGQ